MQKIAAWSVGWGDIRIHNGEVHGGLADDEEGIRPALARVDGHVGGFRGRRDAFELQAVLIAGRGRGASFLERLLAGCGGSFDGRRGMTLGTRAAVEDYGQQKRAGK